MKKIILLLLSLTLILSLSLGIVACGGSGEGDNGDNGGNLPTGPVIVKVEGTEGLAYEVETPKKGSPYAVCTGIGTATETDIVIASHYNDLVVKEVKEKAFKDNTDITSLTFVNGMEKISMYAFQGCTSLFSVTLSETVENIGQSAFIKCENLLNICNNSKLDIKAGSTQYGYVGNYACNVYTATSGTKGEFITQGDYEYFIFANSKYAVKYLGDASYVEIPSDVTGIYKDLFKGNTKIKEVYISNSVQSIGKMAFADCTSLEIVTIAENTKLTSVAELAFSGCEALKEYNFNSTLTDYFNVQYVGDTSNPCYYTNDIMIQGRSIIELEVPNGVKEISAHAFVNNDVIQKLLLTPSVEIIGTGAFTRCYNLKTFWFIDIANSKLTHIKDNAFSNCTRLEALEFPKSLEVIDIKAFNECPGLLTVTIENNSKLTNINEKAFYQCTALKSVYLGHNSSIKTIDKEAFMNCGKMTVFNMGNNCKVESLGAQSFYQCRKLKEFYIPKTCTFIGGYAFGGCFDGLRNDPNTPYMKIYVEANLIPTTWNTNYNSSNCPVFTGVAYPTFPG